MKPNPWIFGVAALLMTGCGRVADSGPSVEEPSATSVVANSSPIPPPLEPVSEFPPGAQQLVDMVVAGMDETVVRNQILLRQSPYGLSAADLIRLTRAGVSQSLISVIQQHDAQLAREAQLARRSATDARLLRELAAAQASLTNRPRSVPSNPAVSAPLPPDIPEAVRPFYSALLPFGRWDKHALHGWIWRPDVARQNSRWQPYTFDGRWLATEQGWYWHSDRPWGWAVFHYGRWERDQAQGWFWVPDTIWAPSWVTFRMNADYLGWAPLPAAANAIAGSGIYFNGRPVTTAFNYGLTAGDYTFVPIGETFRSVPANCLLSSAQLGRVFYSTTVINDIDINHSHQVVNRGIPIRYLFGRGGASIRLSQIEAVSGDQSGQRGLLVTNNGRTTIYRPSVSDITPVKTAVVRSVATNRVVQIPSAAPDQFEIAGRPVVDTSAGSPVVTGYTTAPVRRRFQPQPRYQLPAQTSTQSPPPVQRFIPPAQGRATFGAPVTGFAPAMPMSPPQTLGIPTPVTFPSGITSSNQTTRPAWSYRGTGSGR